jgi:transposase
VHRPQRPAAAAFELLLSVPGIGTTSAIQILAELLLLPEDRDVRQRVAYAGLDPREYSSGTSVHKYTASAKWEIGTCGARCICRR